MTSNGLVHHCNNDTSCSQRTSQLYSPQLPAPTCAQIPNDWDTNVIDPAVCPLIFNTHLPSLFHDQKLCKSLTYWHWISDSCELSATVGDTSATVGDVSATELSVTCRQLSVTCQQLNCRWRVGNCRWHVSNWTVGDTSATVGDRKSAARWQLLQLSTVAGNSTHSESLV